MFVFTGWIADDIRTQLLRTCRDSLNSRKTTSREDWTEVDVSIWDLKEYLWNSFTQELWRILYLDVREYYGLIMIRLSTLKSGRKLVTDSDTETWVETSWAWGTWGYSVISITTSGEHQAVYNSFTEAIQVDCDLWLLQAPTQMSLRSFFFWIITTFLAPTIKTS